MAPAVPHGPSTDAIIAEAPLRTVRRWMCAAWAAATGAEEIPRPLAALMDSTTRRSHAHTWHWLKLAWGFFFLFNTPRLHNVKKGFYSFRLGQKSNAARHGHS